jgi:hypothetical protein
MYTDIAGRGRELTGTEEEEGEGFKKKKPQHHDVVGIRLTILSTCTSNCFSGSVHTTHVQNTASCCGHTPFAAVRHEIVR